MIKKFGILFLFIVTIIGCEHNDEASNKFIENSNEKGIQQKNTKLVCNKTEPKKIGDYISETTPYYWCAKQSDTARYWTRIAFHEEFAFYQFHGQCIYWFFTYNQHNKVDKIELLWSYKTDCLLPMDFLRKSNGVKSFPEAGDLFCEYNLLNDTTIIVKYNFPEWVDKINRMEKDSIFPKYLYLNRCDS